MHMHERQEERLTEAIDKRHAHCLDMSCGHLDHVAPSSSKYGVLDHIYRPSGLDGLVAYSNHIMQSISSPPPPRSPAAHGLTIDPERE